jgi:hypothetical protein
VTPLAPSPVWTLVTPYCKRTRPGRGTNTKAAGFPPLSRPSSAAFLPPFALGLAPTHLGWGTRRHFTRRPRDPPVSKRRQLARQVGACCVLTNSFPSSSRWTDLQLGRPGPNLRRQFPGHVRTPWKLLGPPKLPAAAGRVSPGLHPAILEVAHRAAQHHRFGCHRRVPRRHHLPRPGEQAGPQDPPHQGERADGHRHQVRLWPGGG